MSSSLNSLALHFSPIKVRRNALRTINRVERNISIREMNDELLHDEQWADLARAMDLYDQTRDATELNQLIVATMRDIVESLDDYSGMDDEDDREQQFVITLIESELAQLVDEDSSFVISHLNCTKGVLDDMFSGLQLVLWPSWWQSATDASEHA